MLQIRQKEWERAGELPFRLLDCFRLVTPFTSDALAASFCCDWGGRRAALFAAVCVEGLGFGEFRKSEGEGMVMVSAICGGLEGRSVVSPAWRAPRDQYTALMTARAPKCCRTVVAGGLRAGMRLYPRWSRSAWALNTPACPVSGMEVIGLAQSASRESQGASVRGVQPARYVRVPGATMLALISDSLRSAVLGHLSVFLESCSTCGSALEAACAALCPDALQPWSAPIATGNLEWKRPVAISTNALV
jgi:hypothetical protein